MVGLFKKEGDRSFKLSVCEVKMRDTEVRFFTRFPLDLKSLKYKANTSV